MTAPARSNPPSLRIKTLSYEHDAARLAAADFYIVTVPTPIDAARRPDLSAMLAASRTVGGALKKGDIVVYESTVYPGAIEEECLPVLEEVSGLAGGRDFTVGYSPERINPGDKKHRFESITKVVSAQDAATLDIVADVYGSVVEAGIHRAPSIKVAEAAKVIENTQRDLNIAFMNELTVIMHQLGIDTGDVLAAASTKWNFLNFYPGLVGGHCIGVDPYYLTYRARKGRLPSGNRPGGPAYQRRYGPVDRPRMRAETRAAKLYQLHGHNPRRHFQGRCARYPQLEGHRYRAGASALRHWRPASRSAGLCR